MDDTLKIDFAHDAAEKTVSVLVNDVERLRAPLPVLDKALEDNAMLQRGLDDANATTASMSTEIDTLKSEIARLEGAQGQMKAPVSLTNVMTRDVADLPPLAALAAAPVMEGQAVGERALSAEEEVERHLAAKRAAAADAGAGPDMMPDDTATLAANEAAQISEGAEA